MTDLRGKLVRDRVTDFEGIVTSRAMLLSGSVQSAVTPKSTDKKKMEGGQFIDDIRLEVIGEGVPAAPVDPYTLKLGDRVKDMVTLIVGTVVGIIECLDGCVLMEVQPAMTGREKDNNRPAIIVLDHKRLKSLDVNVAPSRSETGGPSRSDDFLSRR